MEISTSLFKGFATKIRLVSYNRITGKPLRTAEETEQQFTLTIDGRIWFSGYRNDTEKQEKLRKFQSKISPEAANHFLACVGYELSRTEVDWPKPKDSYWEIEITNEKNETYKYMGIMPATNKNLREISEWLRTVMDTDTLLLFDGEARFALTVDPEEKVFIAVDSILHPSKEPCWFFYEGNDINIGDQLLAPFGRDERCYNVEVVNIIVARPENGPVSLRQQRYMKDLNDTFKSNIPRELTDAYKTVNGCGMN